MSAACETCRWWKPWVAQGLNSGSCHIRATTGRHEHTEGNRTYVSAFPIVSSAGWCGEHTPKEPTP